MKPVSKIRQDLRHITGALEHNPPESTYAGGESAIASNLHTLWEGWNANEQLNDMPGLSEHSAPLEDEEGYPSDQDDFFGNSLGSPSDAFDPIFEFGSEAEQVLPSLGNEQDQRIKQAVQVHGIDALAWYVPFHYTGVQWGIYLPTSSLVYLANEVFGSLPTTPLTRIHLAFHSMLNHELFHFATDYTIAQAELEHQEPWFVPASQEFTQHLPNYLALEEQLANAYMLTAFRTMKPALKVKGKQAALKEFVKTQPEGYRDALKVRPPMWPSLLEDLAHSYGSTRPNSKEHPFLWKSYGGYEWSKRFPISPRINWRYCPIHLYNDSQRFDLPSEWLKFYSRLEVIDESEKFLKSLKKQPQNIQRAWDRTKTKLRSSLSGGADFKKWPKGGENIYSARVNNSYRVHFKQGPEDNRWEAIQIGNHKEMGH